MKYEIKQGGKSLGVRAFADTKAFVLKCCLPSLRPKVVSAKRLSTLVKACKEWAEITPVPNALPVNERRDHGSKA